MADIDSLSPNFNVARRADEDQNFVLRRKEDFIDKSLPFHLIVLEWALQTATQSVAAEAIRLERQSDAVLQKLKKKVKLLTVIFHLKFPPSDSLLCRHQLSSFM